MILRDEQSTKEVQEHVKHKHNLRTRLNGLNTLTWYWCAPVYLDPWTSVPPTHRLRIFLSLLCLPYSRFPFFYIPLTGVITHVSVPRIVSLFMLIFQPPKFVLKNILNSQPTKSLAVWFLHFWDYCTAFSSSEHRFLKDWQALFLS